VAGGDARVGPLDEVDDLGGELVEALAAPLPHAGFADRVALAVAVVDPPGPCTQRTRLAVGASPTGPALPAVADPGVPAAPATVAAAHRVDGRDPCGAGSLESNREAVQDRQGASWPDRERVAVGVEMLGEAAQRHP
jgi:hypothetical protein